MQLVDFGLFISQCNNLKVWFNCSCS